MLRLSHLRQKIYFDLYFSFVRPDDERDVMQNNVVEKIRTEKFLIARRIRNTGTRSSSPGTSNSPLGWCYFSIKI
jgi:hypothetical protein